MRKSCWARSLAAAVFVGALFFGFVPVEAVQLAGESVIIIDGLGGSPDYDNILVDGVLGSVEVGQDIPEIVPATVDFMPGADVEGLITVGHSGTVNMYGGDYLSTWGTDFESYPEMTGVSDSSITFYGTNFYIGNVEIVDGPEADGIESVSLSSYTAGTHGGYGVSWDDVDGKSCLIWITASDPIKFSWLGAPDPEPEIDVDVSVDPDSGLLSHDFGEVVFDQSKIFIIPIYNLGTSDLTVSSVTITGSDDFAITTSPSEPFDILPTGIGVDIVVTFTPSVEELVVSTVTIASNDADEPLITVTLTGNGGEDPRVQQIQDVLDFYDDSIADGTLVGYGPGNSSEKRLKALQNMIEAAGDLINLGEYELAVKQLRSVAKKTDGEKRPPDFVLGDSVEALNTMVNELIADLTL